MDRRTLIRDVAMFQVKLVVDGFRDLLLVPISLVVGIISLISGRDSEPGPQFYHLLGVGKQSEQWINLFGALKNAPPDMEHVHPFPDADMDDIVGRLESFVVDEEKRGGMTAQARERLERLLGRLQNRRNAHTAGSADGDKPAP
ncbi:MAG: hypothetical protein QNJ14_14115 [Woeseiaceae bacterium]|nr:hypothetical protein [Woeseiaceae bacterium]